MMYLSHCNSLENVSLTCDDPEIFNETVCTQQRERCLRALELNMTPLKRTGSFTSGDISKLLSHPNMFQLTSISLSVHYGYIYGDIRNMASGDSVLESLSLCIHLKSFVTVNVNFKLPNLLKVVKKLKHLEQLICYYEHGLKFHGTYDYFSDHNIILNMILINDYTNELKELMAIPHLKYLYLKLESRHSWNLHNILWNSKKSDTLRALQLDPSHDQSRKYLLYKKNDEGAIHFAREVFKLTVLRRCSSVMPPKRFRYLYWGGMWQFTDINNPHTYARVKITLPDY